jgi:LysM repeat protein
LRASIILCCALALGVLVACSGGSSSGKAPDSSKVPTATLPANLPEPRIISNAAIQPGGGSTYTVREGDTLAGIATKLGVSLDDLRAANPNVDASRLSIGQTLRVPSTSDAAGASAPTPRPTEPPPPPTAAAATNTPVVIAPTDTPGPPVPTETPTSEALGQTYVVQDGDFPAKIAEKFGIPVEDLLAANPGINPTDMHIGQVIIIPPKRQP